MRGWLANERVRTWLLAFGCYSLLLAAYAMVAGPARLTDHTPYNHFALQADAWLHGRLDLGGPPPDYAGSNDFAEYDGKWYVPFPALPALLLVPLVQLAGGAEQVRDGQFFVWLAPLGPALLLLALEKLRQFGRSHRSLRENLALTLSFGLGTVYFFTAVQGTVWFAAHVVAVALGAAYALCSLDARHPIWAGICLGLGYWARSPLLFGGALFLFEAWRACRNLPAPQRWRTLSWRCASFILPFALCFGLSLDGRAPRSHLERQAEDASVLMLFNAWHEPIDFTLPAPPAECTHWALEVDTAQPDASGETAEGGTVRQLAGRSMLLTAPTVFTSFKSRAYTRLVSGGGGADLNCSALLIPNGVTVRQ